MSNQKSQVARFSLTRLEERIVPSAMACCCGGSGKGHSGKGHSGKGRSGKGHSGKGHSGKGHSGKGRSGKACKR